MDTLINLGLIFANNAWLNWVRALLIVCVLISASILDIKTKRIPNFITFPFMVVSFLFLIFTDPASILESIVALVVIFIIGALGAIGMGDAKLLMGLTLMGGWRTSLFGLFFGAFIFVLTHFLKEPRKVLGEVGEAVRRLVKQDFSDLYGNGEKKPFAPSLSMGYMIAYTVMVLFPVLEVF